MKFSPGDRVRINVNFFDSMLTWLVGPTAGSIARVISFAEFSAYHLSSDRDLFKQLELTRKDIEQGKCYPLKIEWFAPLTQAQKDDGWVLDQQWIVLIDSRHLELLESDKQEN